MTNRTMKARTVRITMRSIDARIKPTRSNNVEMSQPFSEILLKVNMVKPIPVINRMNGTIEFKNSSNLKVIELSCRVTFSE